MLGDQRTELADELGVAAERKVGLDPFFEREQAQLLQARDLGDEGALVGEVGQRVAAPERKRLAQLRGRLAGLCSARFSGEPLEPREVDLAGVDLEDVAGRAGVPGLPAQRLA